MTRDDAYTVLFRTESGKTTLMERLEAWTKVMPVYNDAGRTDKIEKCLADLAHGIYWLLEDKFKDENPSNKSGGEND